MGRRRVEARVASGSASAGQLHHGPGRDPADDLFPRAVPTACRQPRNARTRRLAARARKDGASGSVWVDRIHQKAKPSATKV
jgi:hypothetical protein